MERQGCLELETHYFTRRHTVLSLSCPLRSPSISMWRWPLFRKRLRAPPSVVRRESNHSSAARPRKPAYHTG